VTTGERKSSFLRKRHRARALISKGDRHHTCRIANIAVPGVLLIAAEEWPERTFVRIKLTLPGVEDVPEVNGEITRVDHDGPHVILGIKFFRPTSRFTEILTTFVGTLKLDHEKEKSGKGRGFGPQVSASPGQGWPVRFLLTPIPRERPVIPKPAAKSPPAKQSKAPAEPLSLADRVRQRMVEMVDSMEREQHAGARDNPRKIN